MTRLQAFLFKDRCDMNVLTINSRYLFTTYGEFPCSNA